MVEPHLVISGVHLVQFSVGQAYLWDWGDGLTVIDTGIAGSPGAIVQAIEAIGRRRPRRAYCHRRQCPDSRAGQESLSVAGA